MVLDAWNYNRWLDREDEVTALAEFIVLRSKYDRAEVRFCANLLHAIADELGSRSLKWTKTQPSLFCVMALGIAV